MSLVFFIIYYLDFVLRRIFNKFQIGQIESVVSVVYVIGEYLRQFFFLYGIRCQMKLGSREVKKVEEMVCRLSNIFEGKICKYFINGNFDNGVYYGFIVFNF